MTARLNDVHDMTVGHDGRHGEHASAESFTQCDDVGLDSWIVLVACPRHLH